MLWDIYLYLSCLLVHLLILKYLVFLFIEMQGCYSLASITEVNTLSYILLTTSEKKVQKEVCIVWDIMLRKVHQQDVPSAC